LLDYVSDLTKDVPFPRLKCTSEVVQVFYLGKLASIRVWVELSLDFEEVSQHDSERILDSNYLVDSGRRGSAERFLSLYKAVLTAACLNSSRCKRVTNGN
jgi:hypothetical protein